MDTTTVRIPITALGTAVDTVDDFGRQFKISQCPMLGEPVYIPAKPYQRWEVIGFPESLTVVRMEPEANLPSRWQVTNQPVSD